VDGLWYPLVELALVLDIVLHLQCSFHLETVLGIVCEICFHNIIYIYVCVSFY
jgi:hypothetical protein